MKEKILIAIFILSCTLADAQNIGLATSTPTRAKFEAHGVAGASNTAAIFGSDRGISFMRNPASIGFNMYNTDSLTGAGKYLGNGYAALMSFTHNDPTLATGLDISFYASGTGDAVLPSATRVLRLTNNGRMSISTNGNAILDVGRGTGYDGTAVFLGTNYNTHFNYSSTEDTYIRSGKGTTVIINDIANGNVIFGDGGTRVGLNTASPVYPLEVRQVANTGLRVGPSISTAEHWEWRVVGSPANFILYHQGVQRNYFSPSDGSMHPSSDTRIKTNIRTLYPVMNKLMQIKPVSYEMIADNPAHFRSTGFIAQDVAAQFPQLTFGNIAAGDTLSMDYSSLNVVAVKGIQEEQQRINKIESDLNIVEMRLQILEKKFASMKNNNKSN